MFLIFVIPAGSDLHVRQDGGRYAAGLGDLRRVSVMFLIGVFVCYRLRAGAAIRSWRSWASQTAATAGQPGGNMEGKEVRFGIANSALFATVTTDASCGAVNAMHDSFTPLGGLVPLFNIMTGEVIFGGVGAGLYGILLYCILAVFIAGLMVGRTPEYLGKKIEQKEVKMAMLAVIATAVQHPGLHRAQLGDRLSREGLLESARARPSPTSTTAGRTASARSSTPMPAAPATTAARSAGSTPNTPWYNLTIGLAMLIGRFLFLIPLLAAAGSLAARRRSRRPAARFPHTGRCSSGCWWAR